MSTKYDKLLPINIMMKGLADRNLSKVSLATGVGGHTLARIAEGNTTIRIRSMQAVSDYLRANGVNDDTYD